jgi:hypothetical protein
MLDVVLSVPHAKCENKNENLCDQTALQCANQINDRLLYFGIRSKVIYSEEHRSVVDENRTAGSHTTFRQTLRQVITQEKPMILLDIHSYPSTHQWRHGIIDDMIILYLPYTTRWFIEHIIHLQGSTANDIMMEFRLSLDTLLLEFNDGLSEVQRTELVEHIVSKISIHLKELIYKRYKFQR